MNLAYLLVGQIGNLTQDQQSTCLDGYPPSMATSESEEPATGSSNVQIGDDPGSGREQPVSAATQVRVRTARAGAQARLGRPGLGVLRIGIHGSWSAGGFAELLDRLEDGYKAAAALHQLAVFPAGSALGRLSADDLIQAVTASRLAGGLRLGSICYGSPGWLELIGVFGPLSTVKDGITENREINRKRDEIRRLDERERQQQADRHEEVMEQQQQEYALGATRLRIEAEANRFDMMRDLMGLLPADQQSIVAAQLFQRLTGATEEIADDARIDDVRVLEQANDGSSAESVSPESLLDDGTPEGERS